MSAPETTREERLEELGGFRSFVDEGLIVDRSLASPVMTLWRAYREFCFLWGFRTMDAASFVEALRSERGITLRDRKTGSGRLWRMVSGAALRNEE